MRLVERSRKNEIDREWVQIGEIGRPRGRERLRKRREPKGIAEKIEREIEMKKKEFRGRDGIERRRKIRRNEIKREKGR